LANQNAGLFTPFPTKISDSILKLESEPVMPYTHLPPAYYKRFGRSESEKYLDFTLYFLALST